MDPNTLATSSLFIQGFDNSGKTAIATVILPLKVGTITIPNFVHVMPGPLSYNLLLGKSWLHALGAISSTLHGSLKFVANNKVVTIKVDPEDMHLCQIAAIDQASVVPSFQNYVPTLSSLVTNSSPIPSLKKEYQKSKEEE